MPNQDKERDETLLRMLRTKPKPHKPIGKTKRKKTKARKKAKA